MARSSARERPSDSEAFSDPEGREPDADPVEVAKQILLRQLEVSAKSRQQLAQVLARRAVPAAAAEQALDRFAELGYVDDAAFARSWVESRRRTRGLAGPALRRELREKGIAPELIDQVVLDTADDDAERATAALLVDKKLRSLRGVDEQTATRRLVSMLARKGYSPGLAYAVVRQALANGTPLG